MADDATLIARSKEDMERNIEVLTEAAGKYGLKLNEKKTKVLHVRGTEKVEEVGGYKVEKEVKYLEVWVEGKRRDLFKAEKSY